MITIDLTKEEAIMLCAVLGFDTDVISNMGMDDETKLTLQFCRKIHNDVLKKLNEADKSRISRSYWLSPSFWLSAIKKLFSGV